MASVDSQLMMLEDVIEQYLIKGDVLSKIRNDSSRSLLTLDGCDPASAKALEDNFDFVIQLVATFASESQWPCHSMWKAVFRKMADRYGIFPPRTRKKIVKDWSSVTAGQARALGIHAMKLAGRSHGARNPKILHIKTLIHQVLAEAAPGGANLDVEEAIRRHVEHTEGQEPEASLSSGSDRGEVQEKMIDLHDSQEPVPPGKTQGIPAANVEAKSLAVASKRQAAKEKAPLLPAPVELDGSLAQQVAVVSDTLASSASKDADLLASQAEVLKAARGSKRGHEASDGESDGKKKQKPGQPGPKRKPRAKKAPTQTKTNSEPEERTAAPTVECSLATEPTKPNAEREPDSGNTQPRPKRAPRPPVNLPQLWTEKEAVLRAAGIPIAQEFSGDRKSFTLHDESGNGSGIQILWAVDQVYVNEMKKKLEHFAPNRQGGVTVSIRKQGGWAASFLVARLLAGWP
ncbi:Kinesin-like protein KIF21B [Durusdinium trenchii]|uniref:Kinesin-like protein KIF21B n=1 Tax=Durusdinium trenchii TaxID=1381693 RepID=A0ABP0NAR9_9DINO